MLQDKPDDSKPEGMGRSVCVSFLLLSLPQLTSDHQPWTQVRAQAGGESVQGTQ
jgi:hypothetical protein